MFVLDFVRHLFWSFTSLTRRLLSKFESNAETLVPIMLLLRLVNGQNIYHFYNANTTVLFIRNGVLITPVNRLIE